MKSMAATKAATKAALVDNDLLKQSRGPIRLAGFFCYIPKFINCLHIIHHLGGEKVYNDFTILKQGDEVK
ncbi:MAG: hypothetical protein FWE34_08715 [Defluviitaleaceae bacterium]|nr:hypothetical protein [Defluviitaleaceae bacterium]